MNNEKFRVYKDHPKTCSPDDFWGQVKRTVNGKPVSQDQIDLIVDAVVTGLGLNQDDFLLDLCCGNGALSTLLFKYCSGGVGVDFSEYLISIASQYFSVPPAQTYLLQDAVEYCKYPVDPDRFTKMICYGSFPFIEHERAEEMLTLLNTNFPNLKRIYIGNCPDKNLMAVFYGDRPFVQGVENDPDAPIGIWRTEEEFTELAKSAGWKAAFHRMPAQYYAAHYRYDVILTK